MTKFNKFSSAKILLIGCGRMGNAMLLGFLNKFEKKNIVVFDPNLPLLDVNVFHIKDIKNLPKGFYPDLIIFAVKPQVIEKVSVEIMSYLNEVVNNHTIFLSILAGKTLEDLKSYFGHKVIVRIMPNLPATIGKSVTACIGNECFENYHKELCDYLLTSVGEVVWLEKENLLDAVTALSGSGPAYVFYFLESLIEAGKNIGLNENESMKLAKETVKGSVALFENQNKTLDSLMAEVISPEGTTEAGMNVLRKEDVFKNTIGDAVKAAWKRSKEL